MYTKLSYTEYRCSDQTSPDKSCIMRNQIMGSTGEMHGFIQHRDLYMCYCWGISTVQNRWDEGQEKKNWKLICQ